jgi:hypothetical protein
VGRSRHGEARPGMRWGKAERGRDKATSTGWGEGGGRGRASSSEIKKGAFEVGGEGVRKIDREELKSPGEGVIFPRSGGAGCEMEGIEGGGMRKIEKIKIGDWGLREWGSGVREKGVHSKVAKATEMINSEGDQINVVVEEGADGGFSGSLVGRRGTTNELGSNACKMIFTCRES